MSWDIYGNPLQRGHCEVHPHVHEEYPCSVCLSERRQHDDANRDHQAQHDMILEVEHLKMQRDELLALANNFQITGPDEEGLVWLSLHGNGTTGKAMFNLGSADRLAAQVAMHLEVERQSAIAGGCAA